MHKMNFKNYYNTLSSHQDEINQINHLYLNITSKGLIMDEMPHVEPYKRFDRALFVPAKLKFPQKPTCIFCGSKAVEYHGYTPSTLKHIAADPSFPVFIELKKHRAKYLTCVPVATVFKLKILIWLLSMLKKLIRLLKKSLVSS